MLYLERERENKKNVNFVYIVYLLTKLCNIFDEAFFIDVSIKRFCLIFTKGPDRIWFCLNQVSDFFLQ